MPDTFTIETQKRLHWCWAAVSASIHRYFFPESSLTQCQVVRQVDHLTQFIDDHCCQNTECIRSLPDHPARLEPALEVAGKRFLAQPGHLDFETLKQNIDRGHPVCAFIEWFDGGGHFAAISGYRESPSGPLVHISDPFFVDSILPYEEFVSFYQNGGRWTRSYVFLDESEEV